MDEFLTTIPILWRWIIGGCGMIIALGGAWAVLLKVFKPNRDLKTQLAELARKQIADQEANERRFKKDLDAILELKELNKYQCRGILALLNHELNGNSTDKLTKARDALSEYLIEK